MFGTCQMVDISTAFTPYHLKRPGAGEFMVRCSYWEKRSPLLCFLLANAGTIRACGSRRKLEMRYGRGIVRIERCISGIVQHSP